jgi:hypothetical protein
MVAGYGQRGTTHVMVITKCRIPPSAAAGDQELKIKFSSFVKLPVRQPNPIRVRGQKKQGFDAHRIVVQMNRMPKHTARGFRPAARSHDERTRWKTAGRWPPQGSGQPCK